MGIKLDILICPECGGLFSREVLKDNVKFLAWWDENTHEIVGECEWNGDTFLNTWKCPICGTNSSTGTVV